MATQADVRRIALSLPETEEAENCFAKFFTEPHYRGFPAILVRLPTITVRELRPLITEAWRTQAPKGLELPAPPR